MCKVIFLLSMLFFVGCAPGGGTTTGNGIVDINMESYSGLTASKASPFAVSSLSMCFKRLRFKTLGESTETDPTTDNDNVDLNLGEVSIDPTGTSLGSVTVPYGTYGRVEFDLEKDCGLGTSGSSVRVTNDNGSFSTEDRITIKFEGTFTVDGTSNVLNLGLQTIITALDSVTADNEIETQAESTSGDF